MTSRAAGPSRERGERLATTKPRMASRTARGTTWARLCFAAAELPGVTRGTSYGTPALHVRRKLLARLREDGASVAVRVEPLDRDVLLEADPKAFFLTDHYRPYPWVLMRLADVHHAVAVGLVEEAWRRAAPIKLGAEGQGGGRRRTAGERSAARVRGSGRSKAGER